MRRKNDRLVLAMLAISAGLNLACVIMLAKMSTVADRVTRVMNVLESMSERRAEKENY